ncbi:MAG TPA: TolC family protein [Chitinophagaceae bacterium]
MSIHPGIFIPVAAILLVFSNQANTQQAISLEEAISAATAANTSIALAETDEQIAASRYRQSRAVFLPEVSLSWSALTSNNPLNAFGFKLQQRSVGAEDFNPAQLNEPGATADFITKLEIRQPIVNMDMVYQRKAAGKQVEVYRRIAKRTKEQIRFEVQKVYLQLQLAYQARSVLQESLRTAEAFARISNDYFEQGLMQKSDLLNARLQVTGITTKITELDNNIATASDYLDLLMNRATGQLYVVEPLAGNKSLVDTTAEFSQRADIEAMRKMIEAADLMARSARNSLLPRLNAFANYQFNNNAMFGYDANAYLAGIQLSWDIFRGNRTRHQIAEQGLNKKKLEQQLRQQLDQSAVQLSQVKRELANASYKMKQYEAAVQQAEEALRITQNRFQQGLIKSADVLAAQTQVSQQKLAYTEALYQYQLAVYQIEFLTTSDK